MALCHKSQVIKALIHFFNERKEGYRFICMAPTGSAAALIAGSTYHSMLGFNKFDAESTTSLMQVRNRLLNVDYIFLDEISMVDCRSVYKISERMCKALKNDGHAFGGINMIFAGDFAQLQPAGGVSPLYAPKIGTVIHTTHAHLQQEATIGKALWHQFTTAVILRENMRQKSQTPDDAKLRKALENLRYMACTQADIKHLQGRIAGRAADKPKLNQSRFRNVSVITAWNSYRDKINELGCERFSKETGQQLQTFYFIDKWKSDGEQTRSEKRLKGKVSDKVRSGNKIDAETQEHLWNLPPEATEHFAGKLTLCRGMPVMIKVNEATECCVTNGAEGVIVGWKCKPLGQEKLALETLFVKLTTSPKDVQLEGLPLNVVPVSHMAQKIKAKKPDGKFLKILRDQVPILPNFAMTDYGSQGRTRPNNVCDLQNCKDHRSIYTCLSRGSTYDGTIIVQGFDSKKMNGKIAGYLRQEFRELEMLDEITKLRYEKKLPSDVEGITRRALIYSFRMCKGASYVPKAVHNALKWSENDKGKDVFKMTEPEEDSEWQILAKPAEDDSDENTETEESGERKNQKEQEKRGKTTKG